MICGLLDSIKGKLDDEGGEEANSGSGQLMAFVNEPTGRICSWGIPLAEGYGVRLPMEYSGEVPEQMQMMDVPKGHILCLSMDHLILKHRIRWWRAK